MYKPRDGFNCGKLACGGTFTAEQNHIAYRGVWRMGCGRRVLVCSAAKNTCVLSRVMDAGPFGIYKPPLKRAVKEGRWKVWTKRSPPKGWQWRAVADLSYKLWTLLGRPRHLSKIHLFFSPRVGVRDLLPVYHVSQLPGGGWVVYDFGYAFARQVRSLPEPLHTQSFALPWPLLLFLF